MTTGEVCTGGEICQPADTSEHIVNGGMGGQL